MSQQKEEQNMRPLHPDAIGRETRNVTRKLNEQELADMRTQYTDNAQYVSNAEEEFNKIRKSHKKDIKNVKARMSLDLSLINSGEITKSVPCDLIPDYSEGIMNYVDPHGQVVYQRKLKPTERQTHIPNHEQNPVQIGRTAN